MIYGNPGDALRVRDGSGGERAQNRAWRAQRSTRSARCPIAEVYLDDWPGHG
ncbi:hypothetical protein [Pseudoxanthomonas sp. JBR18]|uniref:hypothetical protein n=1 Tax=Pseudoxanthomonas sp. JBR18 TaxID=2969308 RepID=UPI0023067001|nr:hypothetical protein [Pseudoxanthomonas sp. JBR18]WCE03399.1 hypothetical protein PJ250_15000 [Pseudoxanthomonas sp. JBR18]